MEHVKMSDVNSDMEVAKVFNQLIDKITELETRNKENDAYNREVEFYNGESVEKGK